MQMSSLPAHLEYMIALTRKGVLFAAGPMKKAGSDRRGIAPALSTSSQPWGAGPSAYDQSSETIRPGGTK
jgi:hypothetical protein